MLSLPLVGLRDSGKVSDGIAGVLDFKVEVLEFLVGALKLGSPDTQLVALGRTSHALRSTTLRDVALAK